MTSRTMNPSLISSPSPHIHTRRTVSGAMLHVIVALLPALLCALWYFGLPALRVIVVSVVTCLVAEWVITRFMLCRPCPPVNLPAILTGLLLALNLPSSLPWWTVCLGAIFAIGVAKMAFGGLGCNIFNPAIAGRVFLLISFPALMTEWPLPGGAFQSAADGATGATILSRIKFGEVAGPDLISNADMLLGHMGGSLGETGSIAIIIGFIYLLCVRVISWHIPISIIATVAIGDWVLGAPVTVNLLGGGLLLGAVFMATDYVTSPMTRAGMIVYGVFIGVVTIVIRQWGAYPEGMSFAILLGNAITPLLNIWLKPRRFSPRRKEVAA